MAAAIAASLTLASPTDALVSTLRASTSVGGGASPASTGALVWGGATRACYLLLDVLATHLPKARVLSLGAGVAALELTAALMGANVLATDLPEVLPLLTANVASNAEAVAAGRGKIAVEALDWSQPLPVSVESFMREGGPCPRIIIASDCVFWPHLIDPLVATLAALSAAASTPPHVFLAIESRSPAELRVFEALEERSFEWCLCDEVTCGAPLRPLLGGVVALVWARWRGA